MPMSTPTTVIERPNQNPTFAERRENQSKFLRLLYDGPCAKEEYAGLFILPDKDGKMGKRKEKENAEPWRKNQKFFRLSELPAQRFGGKNKYLSINTFTKKCRQQERLSSLRGFYLDIDPYHSKEGYGYTAEQAINAIYRDGIIGKSVPAPNCVVYSGGGFYFYWLIQPIEADDAAVERWRDIEYILYQKMEMYGADARALDPVRVLRIPGTVNSKQGRDERVAMLWEACDVFTVDRRYTIEEIESFFHAELAEMNRAGGREKNKKRNRRTPKKSAQSKRNTKEEVSALKMGNMYTSNIFDTKYTQEEEILFAEFIEQEEVRFCETRNVRLSNQYLYGANFETVKEDSRTLRIAADIISVISQQGMSVVGHRETALFALRYFLECGGYSAGEALAIALEVNRKLLAPLDDAEVIYATSPKKGAYYQWSYAKLRHLLGLSVRQTRADSTLYELCSPKEKRRRYFAKMRQDNREEAGLSKKEEILQRRKKVRDLYARGVPILQIAQQVGRSVRTIKNDVNALGLQPEMRRRPRRAPLCREKENKANRSAMKKRFLSASTKVQFFKNIYMKAPKELPFLCYAKEFKCNVLKLVLSAYAGKIAASHRDARRPPPQYESPG